MDILLTVILWAILLRMCWPIAILVLLLWPVLWLLSLPLRMVGTILNALLALMKIIVFLPARILGYK